MDIVARILAESISAEIGQPVIVENKPGAGGAIAVQALNAAPPDGQTIMVTASNILTEIPLVMKTSFDPIKDVKPVTMVGRANMVLVAAATVPANDVKALVDYLKTTKGGKGSFASYTAGTSSHYAGMIFAKKAGLDLTHVPFPGSPPALQQLMGGQVDIMFDGMATSLPQIKGGKLKAYGGGVEDALGAPARRADDGRARLRRDRLLELGRHRGLGQGAGRPRRQDQHRHGQGGDVAEGARPADRGRLRADGQRKPRASWRRWSRPTTSAMPRSSRPSTSS